MRCWVDDGSPFFTCSVHGTVATEGVRALTKTTASEIHPELINCRDLLTASGQGAACCDGAGD